MPSTFGLPSAQRHDGPRDMPTYHVYCDESHLDPHEFRVQGGIWVPEVGLRTVRQEFARLRRQHPGMRELGWSCISGRKLFTVYRDLTELFFASEAAQYLSFNCIVVQKHEDPSYSLNREGRDQGFYKAYWTLLTHRLKAGCDHHVRLDEKTSPSPRPAEVLRRALNGTARAQGQVLSCHQISSAKEDILQLADVLCGAVGWIWNGRSTTSPAKREMGELLASHLPWWRSSAPIESSKYESKFNVWRYRPRAKK